MKLTHAVCVAIGIGVSTPSLADDLAPMMDPNRPVHCARDPDGFVWRVQCDDRTRVCLYAADNELDVDGHRTTKALERARECAIADGFDRTAYEKLGYTMRAGRADAPWGWMRDERGRVFQVDFDLRKRLYFGVAYSPQKVVENPLESTRTSFDFGLFIAEWTNNASGESPTRHRLHLLEGAVHLQPFSADVTAFHYDVSHRYTDALLRITTFVGTPQRHDLFLDLGLWTEAGGLELRRTDLGDSQLWKHASAMVTLDLWQSDDLMSFLRVRTGGGLEGQHDDKYGYRSALCETSALDLDTTLDDKGFHNLRFELAHEVPRYFTPYVSNVFVQRMHARVQYEAIVLAINDQPLTFRLAAGGEKRNDVPGLPDQWAFIMDAGLRFNLWAPPRPHS